MICSLVLLAYALQAATAIPHQALKQGLDQYQNRQYVQAVETLAKAVEAEPAGTPAHQQAVLTLGQSYFMLSQAPKAIPWLEKATASNEAFYMLGYAYLQANQPDKSQAAFARLFALDPQSAAGHLLAAQMMLKKDYDAFAEKELQTALALDGKLPEAHFLLAEIALFRGKIDEGIAQLKQELTANPNMANAWYRLGDAYARREDWQAAIPNLQRAVWLNPEFSGPYIALGKCYFKTSDWPNAEGVLKRALSLDPSNKQANYLLSQTLSAAGKKDEAREILEKFRSARP